MPAESGPVATSTQELPNGRTCPDCYGRGVVRIPFSDGLSFRSATCAKCRGIGRLPTL